MGRPKSEEPKTHQVNVRFTEPERLMINTVVVEQGFPSEVALVRHAVLGYIQGIGESSGMPTSGPSKLIGTIALQAETIHSQAATIAEQASTILNLTTTTSASSENLPVLDSDTNL
jgi:hypothetical protein